MSNHINRDNYETFFLLYTDNELSVAEIKEVEEFVHGNPDLQEELVMLQQSVLKPDTIFFDDKESLLKNEPFSAGLEKLLLHLDNELTTAEKKEVDGLIKNDAGVKTEWGLLLQTKLSPDNAVVFKDKHLLYRKEEGRVIAFPWVRVAAAAFFIGMVAWGGVSYFGKASKVAHNEIANTSNKTRPTISSDTGNRQQVAIQAAPATMVKPTDAEIAVVPRVKKSTVKDIKSQLVVYSSKRLPTREIQLVDAVKKDNNLPRLYFENLNKSRSNKPIQTDVTLQNPSNTDVKADENDLVKSKASQDLNSYASATSFTDKSEEDNNNRVLFMSEEKIKKTKLGGFFRKVKRVLERSTNIKSGDNNVKVANMQFTIQ